MHLKIDKTQPKLTVLHQAVDVITQLEQRVRGSCQRTSSNPFLLFFSLLSLSLSPVCFLSLSLSFFQSTTKQLPSIPCLTHSLPSFHTSPFYLRPCSKPPLGSESGISTKRSRNWGACAWRIWSRTSRKRNWASSTWPLRSSCSSSSKCEVLPHKSTATCDYMCTCFRLFLHSF